MTGCGLGLAAAGCSLGCRALAPARAAAAAAAPDDAEEEESRVRRRRMLAVMLLPWLPNSAAAPLGATAAPAPKSARTTAAEQPSVHRHRVLHPAAPLHREQRQRGGWRSLLGTVLGLWENRWSDASRMFAFCTCRQRAAALQRSNTSFQEAEVSFFRGFLHFYKEPNKTAELGKGNDFQSCCCDAILNFLFFKLKANLPLLNWDLKVTVYCIKVSLHRVISPRSEFLV